MTPSQEPTPAASNLMHAIDILAFVEAQEIPSNYFETPYYLAPIPGGEKDYALLRETLRRTRKIGIAYVVIQARQHLAALIPHGQSLVLNTLRWNIEKRGASGVLANHLDMPLTSTRHAVTMGAAGTGKPLQQMQVTGCNECESDDFDDLLEDGLFDSDEVLDAILRPRLHAKIPRAGRSNTTAHAPHGPARPRRHVRRA